MENRVRTEKKGTGKKLFKKGESGNPNGRPKKPVNLIKDMFGDVEQLTDYQLKEILKALIALPEERVKELAKAAEIPMSVKMGYSILKSQVDKGKSDMYRWLFEMQVGSPRQTVNQKTDIVANFPDWLRAKPDEQDLNAV